MEQVIKFTDQSPSFVNGVEVGRIYHKMETGEANVSNNGFPIHLENKDVIINFCNYFGYTPIFGNVHYGEWIDFTAIKNTSLN